MGEPSTASDQPRVSGVRAAVRNLGWLLAGRGVVAVLSLLYLGIATRTLGVTDFGRFALVTGAAQSLGVLVGFQTWQVVVRYGIDHRSRGDEAALGRLYRACMLLDAVSAIVGVVAAVLIIVVWRDELGITPALLRDTIVLMVAELVSLRSAALGVLRLNDRFGHATAADSVTPLGRMLGALAAALFAPDLHGFLWAWAVAEVATAAAYWLLLGRSGDLSLAFGAPFSLALVRRENPQFGRFLVSTNIASTLGLATKQLPLLFVGGFVGPAAAGGFRLAAQLAQALAKLSQLISRAAFPEVVRAVRGVTGSALRGVLNRLFWASAAAGFVILLLVALVGRPGLVLVGGNHVYGEAYPLLLWLAAAGAIDLAVVAFEPVLLAVNRSGSAVASRGAGVALQLLLMVWLLPRIGAEGASIGVFAASLLGALLLGLNVLRFARAADGSEVRPAS
ncbi:lipopolysaccharide biosynthesis protein [Sphingomonas ginkgonis]|uniref:Lipopolysaccharide biosynthesis protein n=1 Tax=Sphingomonas ginkgonis TaxID=2315330 RepID=A0A3R9WNC8_9SPHN|nr:oligosaccharide flippase family protein [Sphingomonas ginkgonis]RST29550.1 lipopolysaccharide biosynthesis protein [Sphingomonas ginkgonis]